MNSVTFVIAGVLLALGCACSGPQVAPGRHVLAEQVLIPRPGYKSLTNQVCKTDDQGQKSCETLEYDLGDHATRARLRDLTFACNVNGKIYRPAQEFAGLIRERIQPEDCFLGVFFCKPAVTEVLDRIPAADTQRMLDAKTVCCSLKQYPPRRVRVPTVCGQPIGG